MNIQDFLRNEVKRLKWEDGLPFKVVAHDLLNMDYHAFINWLHGRCNLGSERTMILKDFIDCLH